MNITPDQADRWAHRATDGPWYVHISPGDPDGTFIYDDMGNMCIAVDQVGSAYLEADLALAAAAPDLAQTIAGMGRQYGAQCDSCKRLIWRVRQEDAESLAVSMSRMHPECSYRLVRRLVGPIESMAMEDSAKTAGDVL